MLLAKGLNALRNWKWESFLSLKIGCLHPSLRSAATDGCSAVYMKWIDGFVPISGHLLLNMSPLRKIRTYQHTTDSQHCDFWSNAEACTSWIGMESSWLNLSKMEAMLVGIYLHLYPTVDKHISLRLLLKWSAVKWLILTLSVIIRLT